MGAKRIETLFGRRGNADHRIALLGILQQVAEVVITRSDVYADPNNAGYVCGHVYAILTSVDSLDQVESRWYLRANSATGRQCFGPAFVNGADLHLKVKIAGVEYAGHLPMRAEVPEDHINWLNAAIDSCEELLRRVMETLAVQQFAALTKAPVLV